MFLVSLLLEFCSRWGISALCRGFVCSRERGVGAGVVLGGESAWRRPAASAVLFIEGRLQPRGARGPYV